MDISIVIPCRNEVNYIEECIAAIYNCDVPESAKIHVFVVDGMSDDGTREIVAKLKRDHTSLTLVDNKKQLTPFAFNLGIYAGGKVDFVQIVGARHILSKNYLIRCINKLEADKETWCVGGRIINEFVNRQGRIISIAMGTSFGMGIGNFRTLERSGYTDTVTSPMYPYWVFEKIGFFDEELIRNQDDDFNYRITKEGGKIYYEHEITLKYYVRGTLNGLWRQFFQYGYWKVYVNKKHNVVTTIRQLVPPLFVLYLAGMSPALIIGKNTALFGSLPLTIYLLLNVFFSVRFAQKSNDIIQMMLVYAAMHVSYGLGYWKGILDFLIQNKKPSEKQKRLSR